MAGREAGGCMPMMAAVLAPGKRCAHLNHKVQSDGLHLSIRGARVAAGLEAAHAVMSARGGMLPERRLAESRLGGVPRGAAPVAWVVPGTIVDGGNATAIFARHVGQAERAGVAAEVIAAGCGRGGRRMRLQKGPRQGTAVLTGTNAALAPPLTCRPPAGGCSSHLGSRRRRSIASARRTAAGRLGQTLPTGCTRRQLGAQQRSCAWTELLAGPRLPPCSWRGALHGSAASPQKATECAAGTQQHRLGLCTDSAGRGKSAERQHSRGAGVLQAVAHGGLVLAAHAALHVSCSREAKMEHERGAEAMQQGSLTERCKRTEHASACSPAARTVPEVERRQHPPGQKRRPSHCGSARQAR